jgi:hypothetical protein
MSLRLLDVIGGVIHLESLECACENGDKMLILETAMTKNE